VPTYERAEQNFNKFDLVLTYHQDFLDRYPDKCRRIIYGGTWINCADWGIKPKSKLCSMLLGTKMSTDGHRIRHEIAEMIEELGFDVDFYGARGEPVGYGQQTKYKVLQDYRFSLAIETCREEGLFSEWIVDCFALGTIPIFWGAPNIHEYFDVGGILQFDTVDRCQKILHSLRPELWQSKLASVHANLGLVDYYSITEDWIYENVLGEFA
jgi:glycosyl transferase family 10 (putative fucosyltransferase)